MKKGFTMIELLVVISIIGLLSSIVFSSLKNARYDAMNANIKESLAQMRTEIALYASNHNQSTLGICNNQGTGPNPYRLLSAALLSSGTGDEYPNNGSCQDGYGSGVGPANTGNAYIAVVHLKKNEAGKNFWCIDAKGVSTLISIDEGVVFGTGTDGGSSGAPIYGQCDALEL